MEKRFSYRVYLSHLSVYILLPSANTDIIYRQDKTRQDEKRKDKNKTESDQLIQIKLYGCVIDVVTKLNSLVMCANFID